ncbi:MAG: SulP family inorganic anion transporter [Saprospiraceae bacterium]|nr:SulP family inorganic anion transporter [Saprospiraceae bacterium]
MNKMSMVLPSKGDLFGGITAGIVALPLALAFGVQSGLGPAAGLYGAMILGFFAAWLGGTNTQISGPTGPMTVITAATVGSMSAAMGSVEVALPAIIVCFILAGIIQIGMGLVKLGGYIKYIPYPVISGFMSGIGMIIILLQIFPAFGLDSPKTTIDVIKSLPSLFQGMNVWATFYTIMTIVIIYLFPKIKTGIPSSLVGLIVISILATVLAYEVPIIGDVPKGLPVPQINGWLSIPQDVWLLILNSAATLAALGAIDSLLTSVVADNLTRTRHDSNKELIGQGIGNAISGLFGGIPGAGATMRTLVNVRSGGKTRASGMIHGLVLLVILVGVGQYAALIPKSVLAGILLTVGLSILDYKGVRHVFKVPKHDAIIMIIVFLVTVFLDLLVAVGIGMVMASILFMIQLGKLMEDRTTLKSIENAHPDDQKLVIKEIPKQHHHNILIDSLDGPLFFGYASAFQKKFSKVPEVRFIILNMKKVPFVDQSGLYAMEEVILDTETKEADILLVGLQKQPKARFMSINVIPDLINEEHIFEDMESCIFFIKNHYLEKDKLNPEL